MNSKLRIFGLLMLGASMAFAQDESEVDESLQISGSVDTYYKYDLSGEANQPTWFGTDQNSVSIGMVNVSLSQTKGKVSFVGDVAFGPRARRISVLDDDGTAEIDGTSTAPGLIQNLYVSYAVSEGFSITAGFMGTFVGYEVISPTANFNYSGSYLFSSGPFQNAGVKADIALGDKVGLMVGAFSSVWDSYSADPNLGMDNIGAQLSVSPTDGLDVYLNYIGGMLFEQWDVTAGYQISDDFYLGLNVSENSKYSSDESGFFGVAGYAQYAFSEVFSLGGRYESFEIGDGGAAVGSFTLSGNIKSGPLTIIPEIRLDSFDRTMNESEEFEILDGDGAYTDAFTQLGFAAVYSF